jgi:3-oxoadipate enol-lactonase
MMKARYPVGCDTLAGKQGGEAMPKVQVNDITMNYDQQGASEPLVLTPYLAADCACYTFQVAEYAKHFTCISVDLRGAGATDKPAGPYSTELFADDVAAFMQAIGIDHAHVFGMSLGAATGLWLAAKYPAKVQTLSLHSAWPKTDPFLQDLVPGWQAMAQGPESVTEMVIHAIFPWCLTPELYAARPEYVAALADFVRGRPTQPLDAFMRQSNAALAHAAEAQLGRIAAPTQITFGQRDALTSTRFAAQFQAQIAHAELTVFEGRAHAPLYEQVEEFNQRTLAFWQRHRG